MDLELKLAAQRSATTLQVGCSLKKGKQSLLVAPGDPQRMDAFLYLVGNHNPRQLPPAVGALCQGFCGVVLEAGWLRSATPTPLSCALPPAAGLVPNQPSPKLLSLLLKSLGKCNALQCKGATFRLHQRCAWYKKDLMCLKLRFSVICTCEAEKLKPDRLNLCQLAPHRVIDA